MVTLKPNILLFKRPWIYVPSYQHDIMTTADYNDLYIKISEDGKPSDNDISKVENLTVTAGIIRRSTYLPKSGKTIHGKPYMVANMQIWFPHWTPQLQSPRIFRVMTLAGCHMITGPFGRNILLWDRWKFFK